MNILMINQPLNNRGDESAHKALLRAVCKEKKNVRLTAYTSLMYIYHK